MAERELIIRYVVQNESRGFADAEKARLKSVADAADRAARQQAAAAMKAAKDSERAWIQSDRERLREFQKITAERSKIEKAAYRDAEREARRSAAAQAKAMKEAADASKTSGIVSSLKAVAAGYIGISLAARGLEFLNTSWEAYNQSIKNGIADLKEYRDAVKELANLKGRLGNTTDEVRAQILFRANTLQSRQDSISYQEGYKNTSQAAVASKAIAQDQADELMGLGGRYQAAAGGSADTQGNFLGGLPAIMASQGKGAVNADQAFAKFGQVRNILSEGGSSESTGFAQLLTNSAYTSTGLYKDIAQQAALQSMFSTSSPNTAGTLVDQFTRATVGGLGKMRGQGVEGGEKLNSYLKGIGATEAMDPIEIGRLISKDLASQRKNATGKGETFSDYGYLSRHGYTDQETRDAILQFSAKEQSGSLDSFMGLANAKPSAEAINQKVADFQATDPAAQSRAVELSGELSNIAISAGPQEFYKQMRELAFNKLKADRPEYYSGTFEEWDKNGTWNAPFKKDVINEASAMMQAEAERVGVNLPKKKNALAKGPMAGMGSATEYSPLDYSFAASSTSIGGQQDEYYKAFQAIGEKGGNPLLSAVNRLTNVAERQLNAQSKTLNAINESRGKKGPVAKPAAGNVGRN